MPFVANSSLSEARNLTGFFVALEDDVPADDDDDQPEYPIEIARYPQISTRKKSSVLTDHGPEQGHGHVRVVPRP